MSKLSRALLLGVPLLLTTCGFPEPSAKGRDGGTTGDSTLAPGDFAIALPHPTARVPAGSFDYVDFTIDRGAGAPTAITVTLKSPPAGVTATKLALDATATSGRLQITGDPALVIGATVDLDLEATSAAFAHDATVTATVTGIPGARDTSFGSNGTGATAITVQSHGGLFTDVTVGSGDRLAMSGVGATELDELALVAVTTPLGILDTSFNTSGIETDNPCNCASPGEFDAIGVLANGELVGAGFGQVPSPSSTQTFIAGFHAAGSEDGTFDFGEGHEFIDFGSNGQTLTAVVVQPDQSILFAAQGSAQTQVFRQTFAGLDNLDPFTVGFSTRGPRAVAVDGLASPVPVYVVGSVLDGGSGGSHDIQLVDLNQQGGNDFALEPGFGSGGRVTVGSAGVDDVGVAVAVQHDHAIVVAGASGGSFVLYRFTPAGALDPTFGTNGRASPVLPIAASGLVAMALQSDGKILLLGTTMIARYLSDGSLDDTFVGTGGTGGGAVAIGFGADPAYTSVAVQSDNRIIVVGGNQDPIGNGNQQGKGVVLRLWF